MAVKRKESTSGLKPENDSCKYFKTVEQMSYVSGIGINTLRSLIENREIDYLSIGNRRLLTDAAIWAWYEKNKISALDQEGEELCLSTAAR